MFIHYNWIYKRLLQTKSVWPSNSTLSAKILSFSSSKPLTKTRRLENLEYVWKRSKQPLPVPTPRYLIFKMRFLLFRELRRLKILSYKTSTLVWTTVKTSLRPWPTRTKNFSLRHLKLELRLMTTLKESSFLKRKAQSTEQSGKSFMINTKLSKRSSLPWTLTSIRFKKTLLKHAALLKSANNRLPNQLLRHHKSKPLLSKKHSLNMTSRLQKPSQISNPLSILVKDLKCVSRKQYRKFNHRSLTCRSFLKTLSNLTR